MQYDTVHARPLTYAEVEALATGEAPSTFEGFLKETRVAHGEVLTPATFTIRPKHHKREGSPADVVYAYEPNTGPNSLTKFRALRDNPVGYKVHVGVSTMFGMSTSRYLFSSPEAEDSAINLSGWSSDAVRQRLSVFVADEKAPENPLSPVFGSQLTVGVVIAGLGPEEVAERAERALAAEFGEAFGTIRKVQTRPVPNVRVNVYTARKNRELLAANVLDSEISYAVKGSNNVYSTEEIGPNTVVGG